MSLALPLFHRIAGQPVIVVGAGDAAEAKRRLVARTGALVVDDIEAGLARGARLAFVAHDDGPRGEADAARLRAAGVLVNVVDRPDLCDFTTPAIVDRAPLLIAVGTGGASAGLAKQIRLRLEALLPQRLGGLAEGLYAARAALRARFPNPGERRRALDTALGEGGALDALREDSAGRIEAWLAGAADSGRAVIEIALRSPDPEELTLREARALGSADRLVYEPGVPLAVLERARADAVRVAWDGNGDGDVTGEGLVVVVRKGF